MLIVKSKYRIAKRLGAGIFDQTQTQKFALAEARSKKTRSRPASDYGNQLLEKQRVRYTYGISERQLARYAKKAYLAKNPASVLHRILEMRVDSVVYRAGLAPTRRAARQIVSHGHVLINGKRTRIPSHQLTTGDSVGVREGSRNNEFFSSLAGDNNERRSVPQWLSVDMNLMKAEVRGEPQYSPAEAGLHYSTVFEFYSR